MFQDNDGPAIDDARFIRAIRGLRLFTMLFVGENPSKFRFADNSGATLEIVEFADSNQLRGSPGCPKKSSNRVEDETSAQVDQVSVRKGH